MLFSKKLAIDSERATARQVVCKAVQVQGPNCKSSSLGLMTLIRNNQLNLQFEHGNTALMNEIILKKWTNVDILKQSHQIDFDIKNDRGESALLLVALAGESDRVKEFIRCGANPKTHFKQGENVLLWVAERSRPGHVPFTTPQIIFDQELLCEAARLGVKVLVNRCINELIPLNEKDPKGNTAFMIAAEHGHVEVMKILDRENYFGEKNKDDPEADYWCEHLNCTNKEKESALMLAVRHGHYRAVQKLIKWRGNPFLTNEKNQTVLDIARENGDPKIIKALERYTR